MTKVAEFIDKSQDQLVDELAKLKKEQFNLRFQRASGQLENTARFRIVRHDIARILTVLGQRGVRPQVGVAKSAEATSAPTEKPAAKPRVKKAEKPEKKEAEPKAEAKGKAKSEDIAQKKPAAQRKASAAGRPTKRTGRAKKG